MSTFPLALAKWRPLVPPPAGNAHRWVAINLGLDNIKSALSLNICSLVFDWVIQNFQGISCQNGKVTVGNRWVR